jgi:hypothetical protein
MAVGAGCLPFLWFEGTSRILCVLGLKCGMCRLRIAEGSASLCRVWGVPVVWARRVGRNSKGLCLSPSYVCRPERRGSGAAGQRPRRPGGGNPDRCSLIVVGRAIPPWMRGGPGCGSLLSGRRAMLGLPWRLTTCLPRPRYATDMSHANSSHRCEYGQAVSRALTRLGLEESSSDGPTSVASLRTRVLVFLCFERAGCSLVLAMKRCGAQIAVVGPDHGR